MYFTEVEGRTMGLKPMNCPHHIQIYAAERRCYRDLPVRSPSSAPSTATSSRGRSTA